MSDANGVYCILILSRFEVYVNVFSVRIVSRAQEVSDVVPEMSGTSAKISFIARVKLVSRHTQPHEYRAC